MSLSAQEIFDKLVVNLPYLTTFLPIHHVVYVSDPFLKGTEQTKKFLESLEIKWWIHNDLKLWLIMDLQEIACRSHKDQQLDDLKHIAFEYNLHTAVLDGESNG